MLQSGSEILVKHNQDENPGDWSKENFFNYISNSTNENIKLLGQVTFDYVLGFLILKAGIQKCNYEYFWTGKTIAKNLFFSKNHPLYRKLTLYLDFDLAQMPETMYNQYKSTIGVKVEGKGSSEVSICENFDFVVKWCNKALKQHLSLAPSHKNWLTACRLYNFMRELKSNLDNYLPFLRLVSIILVDPRIFFHKTHPLSLQNCLASDL